MNAMSDSIPFDDFQRLLDDRLDAVAAARLRARLDVDPALRAEFDAYREVHAFTAPLSNPTVGSAPRCGVAFERIDAARRADRVRRLRPWMAMAATLLVAAAGAAAYVHARPSVVALQAIHMNDGVDTPPASDVPAMLANYRPIRDGRVNWIASLPDARAVSRATGRPLFVWVYHQECPMCVELDRDAMRDGALQAEAAKFVPVKLDVMTSPPEVQGWCQAGWPYLATQTADGKRLVEFAGEMDTAKIRDALSRGEGAAKDALPWPALNEIASLYAGAEAARAAGRYSDAFVGYDALQSRLGAAGRPDDPASATFRAEVDARIVGLRREARDALIEAKKLAETDEPAGARRLSEAAERFRGTPYGNDLAEVEKELRATGRFPVLVPAAK
jgi:hypothetical protein